MYAYLDKAGIMHVVEAKETAEEFAGKSKVVETDVEAALGYPLDSEGRGVIVYGEEDMKLYADSDNITPIPALAELYKKCRG